MLPRTHLLRIQRALYHRLRSHARSLLGGLSPEIKKYFQQYQRDFQRFQEFSTKRELLIEILNSHIVFFGDYHTLSQAQRTVVRLLRDAVRVMKRKHRPIVLALEMLRESDKNHVAAFFSGKISESVFLKKIRFQENWGFSWESYRELFLLAKDQGFKVVGLSPEALEKRYSLIDRDRIAANILVEITEEDPDALVVVLFGDLHCAEKHLPLDVKARLSKKKLERKSLIVHQNNEKFYWKLVEQGVEQLVDVVKIKKDIYCVMNTPPWVKLQSHVSWVELLTESNEREWLHPSEEVHRVEHFQEVQDLIRALGEFLEINTDLYNDFQIKGPFDLAFLRSKSNHYSRQEIKIIGHFLTEFKSLFLPEGNVLFLTNLTINHSASVAAQYLHSKLSGFDQVFAKPRRDFYTYIWIEAMAFVGSKIINHKRKCNGPKDLKEMLHKGSTEQIKIAAKVLEHLERERNYFDGGKKFAGIEIPLNERSPLKVVFYYKVSKALGQIFGQALYNAVFENKISRQELLEIFSTSFTLKDKPRAEYLSWAKFLDKHDFREIQKNKQL